MTTGQKEHAIVGEQWASWTAWGPSVRIMSTEGVPLESSGWLTLTTEGAYSTGPGHPALLTWFDPLVGIQSEIEQLKQRVDDLEAEIETLKAPSEGEVIVLRTIDREQGKLEIRELFQSGETLFYSDIARRLGIDLPLVVELCQELEEEGDIQVDADAI